MGKRKWGSILSCNLARFRERASDVTDFLENTLFTLVPLLLDIAAAGAYISFTYGAKLAMTVACTSALYAGVMVASWKTFIDYSTEYVQTASRSRYEGKNPGKPTMP